jgi:RNA polymerase sigma factor (TIGR02999 family)
MNEPPESDVSELLSRVRSGDPAATESLFTQVYAELRRIAGSYFRGKPSSHTLQPTALVHEAFLRLVRNPEAIRDRSHFVSVAAVAMRQILTDHARKRAAEKRGGGRAQVTLSEELPAEGPGARGDADLVDVLALDAAITELAELRPRQARIVELRYFGGLTVEEVAETLELSRQTIEKEWRHARAWLHAKLAAAGRASDEGAAGPEDDAG